MKTNYIFTLLGALFLFVVSCERMDESIDINEKGVIGNWKVAAYVDEELVSDYFQLGVSFTKPGVTDSITITELGEVVVFWDFAVNATYTPKKESFETKLSLCQVSEDEVVGVKITDGKVIGADSLYFEIEFEDDETPFGTTYEIKGSRLVN